MTATALPAPSTSPPTSASGHRRGRSLWRLRTACLLAVTLVAAGCGQDQPTAASGDDVTAPVACPVTGDLEPAKQVLACAERSLAYIETIYASGSGIVVEADGQRFVATNLHVVEPFDRAEVAIDGLDLGPVPFRGADVAADIALLGPIDADVPALPLADGLELERGDTVYLIGFPGDGPSDDHQATIASGIVSRHRDVPEWEQRYVQSDATISAGQSGGPLFDSSGHLVGISGLSYADFALSLSARDVREAIDRIVADGGDDVLAVPAALPAEGGTRSGTIHLGDIDDFRTFYLPATDKARQWVLEVAGSESDLSVWVSDAETGEPLAVNGTYTDQLARLAALLDEHGVPSDVLERDAISADLTPEVLARETAPGRWTIDVAAGRVLHLVVDAALGTGPWDTTWSSNLELWPANHPPVAQPVAIGDTVEGFLNSSDVHADHLVDLEAGQEVELWARSPQGDVAVVAIPPGGVVDPVGFFDPARAGLTEFDDSNEGLYGLDVRERFTATEAGTYRFRLYSMDLSPTAFRFTATAAR